MRPLHWRNVGPLGLFLFPLWFCSCGEKQGEATLLNKGIVLNPGPLNKIFRYPFSNEAQREIFPSPEHAHPTTAQLAQTWSSNCSGEFEMVWKGFDKNFLARFDYKLGNIQFLESDVWPQQGRTWTEHYGGQPPVQMKEQGVARAEAMGEMRGDPRNYYLSGWSRAYFSSEGSAFRELGKLKEANYFKEPADIGQYFLGGFKVEELAHRLICTLPQKMENNFSWQVHQNRWVDAPPSQKPLVEKWICTKRELGWVLSGEVSDSLEQTSISGLNRPVYKWLWKKTIKAWLDPIDLMPLEIEWRDEGSWLDEFQSSREPKAIHLIHRWNNHFKARRS